jgi:hypothetical protein
MRKFRIFYFTAYILVFFSLPYLNLRLDQCQLSLKSEGILSIISFLSLFTFIASLFLYSHIKGDKAKEHIPLFILMLLFAAPTLLTPSSRQAQTTKNYWEFDGVVTEKYVSKNHAAKALTINDSVFEPFPLKLWEIIKIGDKLEKQTCNGNILINKKEYKFRIKNI